MKLEYELYNPGDLDRTGRCRECEAIYTQPHREGCSYGPGKVGSMRRRVVAPHLTAREEREEMLADRELMRDEMHGRTDW